MTDPEWEFDVEPDKVDLRRMWDELHEGPAIMQFAYLEQLKKHAPLTYARFREWCIREHPGQGYFNVT